jgi:site-specific recombinase XerD
MHDVYVNGRFHTYPSPVTDTALAVQPASPPLSLTVPLAAAIERNPAAVYLAHLAPSSRRVMHDALDTLASVLTNGQADALTCAWPAVRYQHSAALRAHLLTQPSPVTRQPYAPATANRALSALRGVLKECWRLGYTSADDYRQAVDLEPIRGSRLPRGHALSRGDVRELFEVCALGNQALAIRDAAILAVQYAAGLRRAEVVGLDLDDLDRATGTLKIHGKGNKERTGYLGAGARLALEEWLELRGDASGPLFWPIGKTNTPRPGRLSGQAVAYIAQRWGARARVRRFSPHDLRRTFISDLLDAGADISTVQQLAGHAQVTTTARYDRRGEATKQRAAELLQVPYGGRRRAAAPSHKEVGAGS